MKKSNTMKNIDKFELYRIDKIKDFLLSLFLSVLYLGASYALLNREIDIAGDLDIVLLFALPIIIVAIMRGLWTERLDLFFDILGKKKQKKIFINGIPIIILWTYLWVILSSIGTFVVFAFIFIFVEGIFGIEVPENIFLLAGPSLLGFTICGYIILKKVRCRVEQEIFLEVEKILDKRIEENQEKNQKELLDLRSQYGEITNEIKIFSELESMIAISGSMYYDRKEIIRYIRKKYTYRYGYSLSQTGRWFRSFYYHDYYEYARLYSERDQINNKIAVFEQSSTIVIQKDGIVEAYKFNDILDFEVVDISHYFFSRAVILTLNDLSNPSLTIYFGKNKEGLDEFAKILSVISHSRK